MPITITDPYGRPVSTMLSESYPIPSDAKFDDVSTLNRQQALEQANALIDKARMLNVSKDPLAEAILEALDATLVCVAMSQPVPGAIFSFVKKRPV